jgi:hypothetical protein
VKLSIKKDCFGLHYRYIYPYTGPDEMEKWASAAEKPSAQGSSESGSLPKRHGKYELY